MNFPDCILIEKYSNKWYEYHKHYEHEKGGCYYDSDDELDYVTGGWISLYPDGHLTYLWNGIEKIWNVNWKEN